MPRPSQILLTLLGGVLFLLAACGDFDEFDRRRSGMGNNNTESPDRRIIINQGEESQPPTQDGGVPLPQPDSGLPTPPPGQPDSGVTPPTPQPDSGAPPSTAQCGMTTLEQQVFDIVNQKRQAAGLQPYQCDAKAVLVARAYSALMCKTGHFSHYGPDGSTPWTRLKAGGVSYSSAGENIAAGQSTPTSVMTSWMNSPGHRANIMSSSFTYIGVGYDNCGNGYGHYWTQSFFRP